jgi:nicotinamidase-related amidase
MKLDPQATAVVAVHMQGDIIAPDGALGSIFATQVAEADTIAQVKRLLDAARAAGAAVVYTRVAWAPDYADMNPNSPMLAMTVQAGSLKEGTPLAEIVDDLKPEGNDIVVTHKRIGGFSASNLDAELNSRGIDTVVFCGVATNVSLEGTARQASDLGYRTLIVSDACAAATREAHEASLATLGLIGDVVTLDETITALAH